MDRFFAAIPRGFSGGNHSGIPVKFMDEIVFVIYERIPCGIPVELFLNYFENILDFF